MKSEEIQQQIDLIAKRVLEKGGRAVDVFIKLEANRDPIGHVGFRNDEMTADETWKMFYGDVGVVLNEMFAYVAAIPSTEDRQREEYLKRVATALEYGKKVGIAEEFLNPLAVEMKRLSENVITYQPLNNYVVQSANHDRMTLDDDIPF